MPEGAYVLWAELILTLFSDVCALVFDINTSLRFFHRTCKNIQQVFKLEKKCLSARMGQIFSRFPLKTRVCVSTTTLSTTNKSHLDQPTWYQPRKLCIIFSTIALQTSCSVQRETFKLCLFTVFIY